MKITPVKALTDNYIWMIQHGNHAVCVDPSEPSPVLEFLVRNRLMLAQTWVTHPHPDHEGGAAALWRSYMESPVYGESDIEAATHTVTAGTQFTFGDGQVTVWATPGHTDRHTSYLLETSDGIHVFCGDTLFSAGCGRVFTGTIEQLYDSFQRFNRLPENTLFYPAHEYTAANLRFAAHIEPDNADIQTALKAAAHTPTLPVTLAHERRVNPFLRVDLPHVRDRAEALSGKTLNSSLDTFVALRELKNQYRTK
ncbi:TPA: hydroxyacylglutathione hydrolase [Neisseria meningitidis]